MRKLLSCILTIIITLFGCFIISMHIEGIGRIFQIILSLIVILPSCIFYLAIFDKLLHKKKKK